MRILRAKTYDPLLRHVVDTVSFQSDLDRDT
jgi:hypothetical protein